MPTDDLNPFPGLSSPEGSSALWRYAGVSLRGSSHQRAEQPCQDAHCITTVAEEFLVTAIADGAGSAASAEVGSSLVAWIGVQEITRKLNLPDQQLTDADWEVLMADVIKTAQAALQDEASLRQLPVRELATTFILVVANPNLVAAAQVGDGATVIGDKAGNVMVLTMPQPGEYINETTFMTSPEASKTAQITVWRGELSHLAVLSDGLQLLCLSLPACTPYKGFFSPLFKFITETTDRTEAEVELINFLESPRIRQLTDDDLTLVLAAVRDEQQ